MKIDAFSLNFASSRTFTQTQTTLVSNSSSFSSVLEDVQDPDVNTQGYDTADDSTQDIPRLDIDTSFFSSQELTEVSFFNLQAVEETSLSQQFKMQLSNLRQMAHDIFSSFSRQITNSDSASLTRLTRIYTGPLDLSDSPFFSSWENTRTTTLTYEESESVSVTAMGTVNTADNRQIDFSMDLLMEREFFNESQTTVTETGYMFIDPIVVQTGAQTPMLQGAQFAFDLDCDGETEDLAGLSEGYAFLALDLNQDGVINDGSELFGPTTGDGFQELAEYDEDHNMWLDENDSMFDQFVLWNPSADEGTRLTRLKDADVGAVYLGEVSSLFGLTSEDQQMAGQITDTSLALTESGGVMPVYEMDYIV